MSSRVSSLPILLFSEDQVKMLRMSLRNIFIAQSPQGGFFLKEGDQWRKVSKNEWFIKIKAFVKNYLSSNNIPTPPEKIVSIAITFLYNQDISKRL